MHKALLSVTSSQLRKKKNMDVIRVTTLLIANHYFAIVLLAAL
jgi:hypothetical protein